MKLSVVTINYNNAAGLKRTLESVFSQTNKNFEYIVIDGGSTDGSKEILEQSSGKFTRWISEKDKGIYDAMNKGINLCNGDYIYFLNSGDQFYNPTVIENFFQKELTPDILYGNIILGNSKNEKLIPPVNLDIPFFMTGTLWHPCVFAKKSLFRRVGLFNPDFKIAGDYEFLLRAIVKNDATYKYIDLTIALFDMSGISNNPSQIISGNEERRKSWELNFSNTEIKAFENHTQTLRSGEYKWGKILKKILKPFSGK